MERVTRNEEIRELEEVYQRQVAVIVICGWCKTYLGGYGETISHGICRSCAEKWAGSGHQPEAAR